MSEFLEPGKYRFKITVKPDPRQLPDWCDLTTMVGAGIYIVEPHEAKEIVLMNVKNRAIAKWHSGSGGARCNKFTVTRWSLVKI